MSSVSAADNVTDVVATDDVASDDVAATLNQEVASDVENQDVLASSDDSPVAIADNGEVLSGYWDAQYNQYTIKFDSSYTISAKNGGRVTFYVDPYKVSPWNAYNFYFAVYEGYNANTYKIIYKSEDYAGTDREAGNYYVNFAKNQFLPGEYVLFARNTPDNHLMARTVLKVSGEAVISVPNDYSALYNSPTRMTGTVKDKATGKPLAFFKVKAVFTNGQTTVTRYCYTNANGELSFIPAVDVGTWTVTFSSGYDHVRSNSVKKSVTLKKSNVAIKAYNIKGYQGLKITLKAVVKSQNRPVNNGIVTFTINGKSYNVNVKNGVASKVITLSQSKVYRYYAVFKSVNFNAPKKTYANAAVLKRYATKLIFKKVNVYYRSVKAAKTPFYVYVRTADGKVVPAGKVKIIGTVNVNRKGVAKFYLPTDICYVRTAYMYVHYYKKVASKLCTVQFIPSSNAYKPCTAKVLFREFYKCTLCGSTTSHSHNGVTYIVS